MYRKVEIELLYNEVDFTETVTIFDIRPFLPETVTLYVWGVVIDDTFLPDLRPDLKGQLYIAGFTKLTINNVVSGKVRNKMYDDQGENWLYDSNGEYVIRERIWNRKEDEIEVNKFYLESVQDFPDAWLSLELDSRDRTMLMEFDDEDLVSYHDFLDACSGDEDKKHLLYDYRNVSFKL